MKFKRERTAKQKFQFARQYNLKGQLSGIRGAIEFLKKGTPLTIHEKTIINQVDWNIQFLLDNLDANTKLLKETLP